jgi:Ras-related protein Rab-1A
MTSYDQVYKIVIIGDSNVGKSQFLLKYINNTYNESYISTIGVDFKTKTFSKNNKTIKFQIWDTAGQERFRTIVASYYRGAHYCIIMFDIGNMESFDNVTKWLQEYNSLSNNKNFLLVGTKSDLKNVVSDEVISQFVKEHDIKYFKTSSKNGDNIHEVFNYIADELLSGKQKQLLTNIHIASNIKNSQKKTCCTKN